LTARAGERGRRLKVPPLLAHGQPFPFADRDAGCESRRPKALAAKKVTAMDHHPVNKCRLTPISTADAGEHIVYVGGTFEMENFDNFKNHAKFFGHRFNNETGLNPPQTIITLGAWLDDVAGLPPQVGSELQQSRYGLKQVKEQ